MLLYNVVIIKIIYDIYSKISTDELIIIMKPYISVIICTHNPRKDYIERVLKALASQTIVFHLWELIFVDNASEKVLYSEINLDWHPFSRHFREEKLGLTSARICGINHATADILVFVDDDNVLDSNYLENVLQISQKFPMLGAWGGQSIGEYEKPLPNWATQHLALIGVRKVPYTQWSNLPYQNSTTPFGAGLCIRKIVAEKYASVILNDSRRVNLGRIGNTLSSCEDTDMALTACDIGLGTGVFTSLNFIHLIPASRLTKKYFLNLMEKMHYSATLLSQIRGTFDYPIKTKLLDLFRLYTRIGINKKFLAAYLRGKNQAIRDYKSWGIK